MTNNATLLCLAVGVFWAATPLLGRFSSANGMMGGVLSVFGMVVAIFPIIFSQNYSAASPRALMFGLLSGITNGIGLLAYYRIIAGSGEGLWEISRVIPIAYVLVPIGLTIGSRFFFGEAMTNDKLIGLALACGAIWFLK